MGNINFASNMIRRFLYIFLFCIAFPCSQAWADLDPVAVLLQENGTTPTDSVKLHGGDTYTGSAPLVFSFQANIANPSSTLRYEWDFSTNSEFTETLLTRFDENTEYTFNEAGKFYIRLQVTNSETGETDVSDVITVTIAESDMKVPNAFSPNGDGVNDVFLITHKSLVSFHAVIFNRWGQQLYEFGLEDIDKGWDGTAHGKQMPVGVYFIVIEAKGADGVVWNKKSDINILR